MIVMDLTAGCVRRSGVFTGKRAEPMDSTALTRRLPGVPGRC